LYSEYPLPGGSVLSQGGGGHGVQMADWLGTIRAYYSYTGGSYSSSSAHAPFGETYGLNAGYPWGFGGEGMDDGNTANTTYWFPERKLRTSQGRWMSPDPAGLAAADPTNPQSWNRYAYVLNNPLSNIDPMGLYCDYSDHNDPSSGYDPLQFDYHSRSSECSDHGGQWVADAYTQNGADVDGRPEYAVSSNTIDSAPLIPLIASDLPNFIASPSTPANNGSWLQQGLNYLKNHPVFISVNEIAAAQFTVQWSTKTVCGNLGAGASFTPTKFFTVGVYNAGNMSNWTNVLSSWGYSFGANVGLGYQASTNSSGKIGGPTISGLGLSGSYTHGGCKTVP
jgi:RHS repeat-associated protein